MGAFFARHHAGVEEVDLGPNHAYYYPPKTGNYFGTHFIMGGERFDYDPRQPEAYLFGENADLNFLGSRPTPFPYPPPQPGEPTKTLKALVNIRRETLRFVKMVDTDADTKFTIEFTLDADCRCAITLLYFCTEEMTPNGIKYIPRDASTTSETYHYKKGANQQFVETVFMLDPSLWSNDDLFCSLEKSVMPIVIQCVAEEGEEPRQQHITIAGIEKFSDNTYGLKAFKQKLFVDGLCYLLQEIYGIENKNVEGKGDEDECEDSGGECVVCMCDVRDTLILPCRHLCLCNGCADSLRYQASCCPICRAPFRALLQVRAVQRCANSDQVLCHDGIPAGYEPVSLIEALNGDTAVHTPRCILRHNSIAGTTEDGTTQTERQRSRTPSDNQDPSETRSLLAVVSNADSENVEKTENGDDGVEEPAIEDTQEVAGESEAVARIKTVTAGLVAPLPGTPHSQGSRSDRDSFSSSGSTKLLLPQVPTDSKA